MYYISQGLIVSVVLQPVAPGGDRETILKVAAEDTVLDAEDVEEGNM
jgi:hypothetical protein